MGTYHARYSTRLEHPMDDVWRFLTTDDSWRKPFVRDVEALQDGEPRVGAQYANTIAVGPMKYRAVNEIIRLDPPRHMAWKDVSEKGPVRTVEGSYTLEPDDGGTRFTLSIDGATKGMPAPLARLIVDKVMAPKMLRQLTEGVDRTSEGRGC